MHAPIRALKLCVRQIVELTGFFKQISIGGVDEKNFTYDANGNIKTLNRWAAKNNVKTKMDGLSYAYYSDALPGVTGDPTYQNRLRAVFDGVGASIHNGDFDNMVHGQGQVFAYDSDGRMVKDTKEKMRIDWLPFDKPFHIIDTFVNGSTMSIRETEYGYDAMHQRVEKIDVNNSIRTAYLRDASGNIMAVYQYQNGVWSHQEQHASTTLSNRLFGADRTSTTLSDHLGVHNKPIALAASGHNFMYLAVKKYELSNHLCNVMAVVTDRRFVNATGGFATADIVSATDYFVFGMEMAGRTYNSSAYDYGFNGNIEDSEILSNGRWQDYGFRAYRNDICRFVSVDPLKDKYPNLNPYHFCDGNSITNIEIDGRDFGVKINHDTKTIVVVANVYAVSKKTYNQVLAGAKQWNEISQTENGYTVKFDINIFEIPKPTNEEVINWDGSKKINFYKGNGKIRKSVLKKQTQAYINFLANANDLSDPIGNAYYGTEHSMSKAIYANDGSFTAGVTYAGSATLTTTIEAGKQISLFCV
jgi:RHS repeat-associated protein